MYYTILTPVLVLIPMFILIGILRLLIWNKERKTASPISKDLLRPAGYTLRGDLDDSLDELMFSVMLVPFVIVTPLVMTLVKAYFFGLSNPASSWFISFSASAVCFVYSLYKLPKIFKKIRNNRLGLDCEIAVGQCLENVVRPENSLYRVYHDVPFDGFNIDHLAVTPTGVFVIETKGRSKPINSDGKKGFKVTYRDNALHFPNHVERKPIEQTQLNVKAVREWLNSATGFEVPVKGVLVIPGWYVELKQKASDPLIMNETALPKVLPQLKVGTLDLSQVKAIAYQVEQKVRDISTSSKSRRLNNKKAA